MWTTADSRWHGILPERLAQKLSREGEIRNTLFASGELQILPNGPGADSIRQGYDGSEATISVEYLSEDRLPSKHLSSAEYGLRIFNTLRSISTLAGIEYYSASRGRMRTYLYEAYQIEGPDDRSPREDPIASVVPDKDTAYAYLRDSSLGRYVARVDYGYSGNQFIMTLVNHTKVTPFIITLAQPGELKMHVLLIPSEEHVLFYGLAYVNTGDVFGIAKRKEESFYNRLKALFAWFRGEIDLS